ncbi:MAG: energy transducer TonB [Prevotella sp.]|nr:energy transducer TonB [Prevotella sp.]
MELKKSYEADLERRRPMVLAVAFVAATVLFAAVLFIPFRSLDSLINDYFDDYAMDLDLKANEQDDMIAAAQPEPVPEQKQEPTQINKVDEVTELAPEQLEQAAADAEEEKKEDKEDEVPPINQNGDDEEIRQLVEQLPEYPGGMVEFMKWLTKTLKYPDEALRRHTEGKVVVSFIVNKDGSLSNIKVVRSGGRLLDDEAMRVMHMMPKWKPGQDKGKPCRTMVAIPIVFEI